MENREEMEIDLLDLLFYLKKKLWVIVAAFLACAVLGMAFTALFIDTEYTANTRIYILNRSSDSNVSYSDVQISNILLDDYVVLITGENVTKEVIKTMGLDMKPANLEEMISVTAPSDTRVVQISVTDTDAQRAAEIANCIREVASKQIKSIMDVDAVNLIYEADVPEEKSGPSLAKNTLIAAMLGLVAAVGVFVVIYILDDTIRTEEDVERFLGLSVLGAIPESNQIGVWSTDAGTTRPSKAMAQRAKKK